MNDIIGTISWAACGDCAHADPDHECRHADGPDIHMDDILDAVRCRRFEERES